MFIDLENSEYTGTIFTIKTIDNLVVVGNMLSNNEAFIYATLVFDKVHFKRNRIVLSKDFVELMSKDSDLVKGYFTQDHLVDKYNIKSVPDKKMCLVPDYKEYIYNFTKNLQQTYNTRYNDNYFIGKNVY